METRYSQIEKEALAIVWGVEHFHMFLYGKPFILVTDHKPLQYIFNNPLSSPTARIQRWLLRLQRYSFTVEYRPGHHNPADYLSRHPLPVKRLHLSTNAVEDYVLFVRDNAFPAISVEDVAEHTRQDVDLQCVVAAVRGELQWNDVLANPSTVVRALASVRHELTVSPGATCLLRRTALVLPASLQRRAVQVAHEGHLGIVKTKNLLRESVWFPRLDRLVEEEIGSCTLCQAATYHSLPRPPLEMTELPQGPWKNISADFVGPFPSGDSLLVVTDEYSRYPVVQVIRTTSAKAIIPKLAEIFSMLGLPDELKSDNGPPFNSRELADFAKRMGFKHRKITPMWPRANGLVERFMQTIEKSIRIAQASGHNWKEELQITLMNYRASPHQTTGKSPAELLLGRPMKTKLPSLGRTSDDKPTRMADVANKTTYKTYSDKQNKAKRTTLRVGDKVLVRQQRRTKYTLPFSPEKMSVIDVSGSMITAERSDGSNITRNISFFKKVR